MGVLREPASKFVWANAEVATVFLPKCLIYGTASFVERLIGRTRDLSEGRKICTCENHIEWRAVDKGVVSQRLKDRRTYVSD